MVWSEFILESQKCFILFLHAKLKVKTILQVKITYLYSNQILSHRHQGHHRHLHPLQFHPLHVAEPLFAICGTEAVCLVHCREQLHPLLHPPG